MDRDDRQVGRILTRREALALLGSSGVTILTGCSSAGKTSEPLLGACVVRPEQTEGPFFVDELLNRSDIRSDPSDGSVRPGVPLQLTFNLSAISGDTCTPAAGLFLDIWHCDALGVYSDVESAAGSKFLRGYQVTDAEGRAGFTTIYPGWYTGRTVHIHFKIRSALEANPGFEFTSQLYFDDELTDQVLTHTPYSTRGRRTTRNSSDGIYRGGGSQLLLAPTAVDDGYAATMDIALAGLTPVRTSSWSFLKFWAGLS
jgi:protocatechuate 3,4-dioxygenase beta subunit